MSYVAAATPDTSAGFVVAPQPRRQPRQITAEQQLRTENEQLRRAIGLIGLACHFWVLRILADLQEQHQAKVQQVVNEANAYIEQVEARANESIATSQQAQVDHDNEKLATWAATCEILQAENEQLRARVAALEAQQQPQQAAQPRKARRTKLTAKERRAQGWRQLMEGDE